MRVAVIVAAAVTGTGQLPAREYSARIDRDQPMQAGEDPYQRCRRIIHITCRCVIFSSSVLAWGRLLELDGFFEGSGVDGPAAGAVQSRTVSCFIYKQ